MLKPLQDLNWRWLFAELVIVFVGLFGALQFDEWREQQELYDAETRYLQRLDTDLRAFIEYQERLLVLLERNYRAVKHVNDSLMAGEIMDGDTQQFELGIVYLQMLPSMSLPRAAYDEMVASGMFVRLRSESLKQSLSGLYGWEAWSERNFTWWRVGALELERDFAAYVTYGFEDGPGADFGILTGEPDRRVTYDFDAMRSDPLVRSGYYWAVDIHSDWIDQYRRIRVLAEETVVALEVELAER
jgi:hypothetical protein